MITNRRAFCLSLAASPLLCGMRAEPARITRIRVAQAQGRFSKFVAMNAYDKTPKGETYEHPLIRIETTRKGVEGIGAGLYAKPDDAFYAALKKLVGVDPLTLFEMEDGRVVRPSSTLQPLLGQYSHLDAPLLDLVGKLTGKPVWKLLGNSLRDEITAYDGTLYFTDVLHPDRGVGGVTDECKESVDAGYSGVKIKLGRNLNWMPGEAGKARDIAVVQAVRKAIGPSIKLMADPNNGYRNDFDGGWHLLETTAADNLYWIEELFPENVAEYARLRDKMTAAGMKTLYADGENFSKPSQFAPYLRPRRLVDVLQLDIRRGGFLANRELAQMGERAGAMTIPHNWASQIGVIMALHLAKVIKCVPMVEDDRSKMAVLVTHGYSFNNGTYHVSEEPGLGLEVNENLYRQQCTSTERIVA